MKVGNSPVYFIPGQETMLEKFSEYLKSKEKEAFALLKEKRFLEDKKQDPAIRIALREIKDFAIAFKKDDEIFWRYFTIPENEFKLKIKPIEKSLQPEQREKPKEKTSDKKKLNIYSYLHN